MTGDEHPTDEDSLIELLRGAADRAGPVPADVVVAGKAAFLLRGLDAALAELVADSATMAGAVRTGDDAVRLLVFESTDVSVELQVEQTGPTVTISGVATGAVGRVVVQTTAREFAADLDEGGWFSVTGVDPGPIRVRLIAADGTSVVTSWTAT